MDHLGKSSVVSIGRPRKALSRFVCLVLAVFGVSVEWTQGVFANGNKTAGAETSATPPRESPNAARDPSAVARGKRVFSVNCAFCHGSDARGGEGGPNLLHSPIVMNDQHGELIGAIVTSGRPDKGMPKFDLPKQAISDIADYVHGINAGVPTSIPFDPKRVLVGNAAAGKKFFNGEGHCTSCHAEQKDLAGIGSKYGPKDLQDAIFGGGPPGALGMPSTSAPPRTATLKVPGGDVIQGQITYIDDFVVVLNGADGVRRTFRRDNGLDVRINDPMKWHLEMARHWEDRDLHDVTAYLITLQ